MEHRNPTPEEAPPQPDQPLAPPHKSPPDKPFDPGEPVLR
ncbi:hypothetical protein ABIE13_002703 [Ottowia thiooxydans]|uniref:Uncharacterized protein n=1 Tax=Ottowia thiooxydans TaxID=219182 RepID=A0ABV2Q997_9BURK